MRAILLAALLVIAAQSALAQSNTGTNTGGASAATGVPPAPTGHRQPKRADVPTAADDQAKIDEADRALDRKIRSICRGC